MLSKSKKGKAKDKVKKKTVVERNKTAKGKISRVKLIGKIFAVVRTYRNKRRVERLGRGFSLMELKQAGIKLRQARKSGIRVDIRRKTTYTQNVKVLKSALSESD